MVPGLRRRARGQVQRSSHVARPVRNQQLSKGGASVPGRHGVSDGTAFQPFFLSSYPGALSAH